ncbi:hypothetical protein E2542_SST23393 [Spatholobus suberectus]|nr:hypothetical protein E2542_SST23393 [Spatholobus suberectus]
MSIRQRPYTSSSDSCSHHRRVTLLPPWIRSSESQSRQSLRRRRAIDGHDATSLHHTSGMLLMCLGRVSILTPYSLQLSFFFRDSKVLLDRGISPFRPDF